LKSGDLEICEIDPEVKKKGKAFRFRKSQVSTTAAIVRKCK